MALVSGTAHAADTLHFAVGPLQPTPGETKKAFDPFFKHLAEQLGVTYTLEATTDWAGIAVALASGQVDVAWMGPWGYVIAHHQGAGDAIATAKYDGKPVYHAIVIARPDLEIKKWPDDGKGLRISFADVGSTSGWLIPTFWFKSRGLDPKTYFQYHEGATHAANEIAVANGQTDLATDFDRNRTAMIESGAISPQATKIVWTSDDLPNDAIGSARRARSRYGKKGAGYRDCDHRRAGYKPYCQSTILASSHRATPTTSLSRMPASPSELSKTRNEDR